MDELISRQAAIDAITDELDKIDHVPQWVFDKLESAIKQLPPIQPVNNSENPNSSDAISRKALINKLEQWQKQDGYDNGEWNLLVDVITEIKNMPLATDIYVGTNDAISRQQAIDAINEYMVGKRCDTDGTMMARLINELVIKQLPSIQPDIICCKDCVKHNKGIGDIEEQPYGLRKHIMKDEACPLVSWRGKAQGHEFDYQFCAYGKRREVTT